MNVTNKKKTLESLYSKCGFMAPLSRCQGVSSTLTLLTLYTVPRGHRIKDSVATKNNCHTGTELYTDTLKTITQMHT